LAPWQALHYKMALQHAIEGPIKDKSVLIILERSSDPDRPVMEFSEAPKSCFFWGGKMRFNKKAMELMFYDVL
jgi:hypothetical protein